MVSQCYEKIFHNVNKEVLDERVGEGCRLSNRTAKTWIQAATENTPSVKITNGISEYHISWRGRIESWEVSLGPLVKHLAPN